MDDISILYPDIPVVDTANWVTWLHFSSASTRFFSVSAPYPEVGPPHAQVVQVRDSAPPTWQVDFARAKKFVHVFG